MTRPPTCKARQHSDQMLCACGLAWDKNDPHPPECRSGVVAKQEVAAMRETLQEPSRWAQKTKRLLRLQEMPLRWLPAYGIWSGMYQINWTSLPDAAFVLVESPSDIDARAQGRDYRFFDVTGKPYMDVQRREGTDSRTFAYRYANGEWGTE